MLPGRDKTKGKQRYFVPRAGVFKRKKGMVKNNLFELEFLQEEALEICLFDFLPYDG